MSSPSFVCAKARTVPFLRSDYLGREVFLDELGDLTDQDLRLLLTEADGIREETSDYLRLRQDYTATPSCGPVEKKLRVANRFIHAIGIEQTLRQKQGGFADLVTRLSALEAQLSQFRAGAL